MSLNLQEIPRIENITRKAFLRDYVRPQKPVVVKNLINDWPAYDKWNLDYIREVAGEKIVPLYDDRPVSASDGFNEAHATMSMHEYVDLLEREPTNYRIFLYNLMKEVPGLKEDFRYPKIGLRLLREFPMLFFGGTGSKVFMHFDIDYSNILHFHFHGKKRCVLFAPDQTKHLYKIPHSLISREDINWDDPDYDKWPALRNAKGHVAELNHGEMLYMPEGYWHYMKYLTPGFSMSLRSIPRSPVRLGKALYNLGVMRHYDNWQRKRKGQAWIDWKNEEAVRRTHKNLGITDS